MPKSPLNAAKFSCPFFTLKILESKNVWGTSIPITVSSECSSVLSRQHAAWEAYVGVKRSREPYVSSGDHCKEQWKCPWISGNVFSRSRYALVCGQDSKAALLPETFQVWGLAASPNFVERQFQYSGTQWPTRPKELRPVKWLLFFQRQGFHCQSHFKNPYWHCLLFANECYC